MVLESALVTVEFTARWLGWLLYTAIGSREMGVAVESPVEFMFTISSSSVSMRTRGETVTTSILSSSTKVKPVDANSSPQLASPPGLFC